MHALQVSEREKMCISHQFVNQSSSFCPRRSSFRLQILPGCTFWWVIFICHLEKVEFKILNQFKEGLNLRRDVFAYLNKLGGQKLCRVGISAIACSHEFWIK